MKTNMRVLLCALAGLGVGGGCASTDGLQQEAYEALKQGDYQMATEKYSAVIDKDAENSSAYIGRGVAFERSEKTQQALEDFNNALKVDPNNVTARLYRAELHLERGELETAGEDVTYVLNVPEGSVSEHDLMLAYGLSGRIAWERGDKASALARFQQGIDLGRKDRELSNLDHFRDLLYMAAEGSYRQGRYAEARVFLEEYRQNKLKNGLSLTSDDAYLLCLIHYLAGDFNSARSYLTQVSQEGRMRLATETKDEGFFLGEKRP